MTADPAPGRRDAAAVGLRYVSPDDPGITRRRSGRGFTYADPDGRPVRSRATLDRIRALAIPPAWTEVWICPEGTGHLQATGRDARGRRQYRYHARFRARRDRGKFERLVRFGAVLPRIRRQVRRDLGARGLPREKVLAAVVSLLELTRLRVGNAEYARLNRSFGLSTLRNRHARVAGTTVTFRFRGKGGRAEERALVDRRLAAIVRRCQELPGQALFQYVDEHGTAHRISSEDVNDYLRDAAGSDEFSARDFRTWAATLLAYRELREVTPPADDGRPPNPIRTAIERTAIAIGDTPAVTRGSYVHPGVLAAFEPGTTTRSSPASGPRPAPRHTIADAPPTRRDELELIRLLRQPERHGSASRRGVSQSHR